jgi:hypothetical protein
MWGGGGEYVQQSTAGLLQTKQDSVVASNSELCSLKTAVWLLNSPTVPPTPSKRAQIWNRNRHQKSDVYCGIPQYLQVNYWTASLIKQRSLLFTFKLIHHSIIILQRVFFNAEPSTEEHAVSSSASQQQRPSLYSEQSGDIKALRSKDTNARSTSRFVYSMGGFGFTLGIL